MCTRNPIFKYFPLSTTSSLLPTLFTHLCRTLYVHFQSTLLYSTLLYLTSPHLTSPHLTSPHLTSPHLTDVSTFFIQRTIEMHQTPPSTILIDYQVTIIMAYFGLIEKEMYHPTIVEGMKIFTSFSSASSISSACSLPLFSSSCFLLFFFLSPLVLTYCIRMSAVEVGTR